MDYDIIFTASIIELRDEVTEKIKRGWVPCGGVAAVLTPDGKQVLVQAITKSPK